METLTTKQPAGHDCSRRKHTNTVMHQAPWSFLEMPLHGGGMHPRRKGLYTACILNKQRFQCLFPDSGMHVVLH